MTIKVKLTLNIVPVPGRVEINEIDVPDNWPTLSPAAREEALNDTWNDWAGYYIAGNISPL